MYSLINFFRKEERIATNMYNIKLKLNNNNLSLDDDDFTDISNNKLNLDFIQKTPLRFFDDILDCINISLECLNGYNYSKSCYVLFIKYEEQIIMTMFVFPHKHFQFNMLITKHISGIINLDKKIHTNIAMYMHSYASSLFNSSIIATRPLPFMLEILKRNVDIKKVDKFKQIFNCTKTDIDKIMGIADDDPTYYFNVDEKFKNLYKESKLNFSYIKVS